MKWNNLCGFCDKKVLIQKTNIIYILDNYFPFKKVIRLKKIR